jgi:isopenicillin N synthase-like dioxygenase
LKHLAAALSVPEDWFTSRHEESKGPTGTVFRLLYYPKETNDIEPGIDIRAGAHSDYGSITLLFQLPGQPGLEIKTPEGKWAAVPVDPSMTNDASPGSPLPILCNIGDLLEDWTAGLLKSTVHRVIFPHEAKGDRYSIAYFNHPLDDAVMEPVPSEMVREHAMKNGQVSMARARITAKDHLMQRLAATYTVDEATA